jgi:serine/threonine protein phosphatase PrpC
MIPAVEMHEAAHQGYTRNKPPILFDGQTHPYTEDSGATFEVQCTTCQPTRTLTVSSVCDGHAGHTASYAVTRLVQQLFQACIDETRGDVSSCLRILFERIALEMTRVNMQTGTTCNVTVFDTTHERVYVASLGDSPTLRYRKGPRGRFHLAWKSDDHDCGDTVEVERMLQIHRANGEPNATAGDVVFQVHTAAGEPTGVWRNRRTMCMTHGCFGDLSFNYYPNIVTTIPRIYVQEWRRTQRSDVWVQCTDGLLESLQPSKLGIQPCGEKRVQDICQHLDNCQSHANIAHSLHDMQVDAILKARKRAHPTRVDNTREWVESTFDNHLTKVFKWRRY